jgi:hypothetical protein
MSSDNFFKDEFFTEQEFAEAANISVRTLRRWRQLRIGPPFIPFGKSILYRKESARDHLISQEQQPVRSRQRVRKVAEAREMA